MTFRRGETLTLTKIDQLLNALPSLPKDHVKLRNHPLFGGALQVFVLPAEWQSVWPLPVERPRTYRVKPLLWDDGRRQVYIRGAVWFTLDNSFCCQVTSFNYQLPNPKGRGLPLHSKAGLQGRLNVSPTSYVEELRKDGLKPVVSNQGD